MKYFLLIVINIFFVAASLEASILKEREEDYSVLETSFTNTSQKIITILKEEQGRYKDKGQVPPAYLETYISKIKQDELLAQSKTEALRNELVNEGSDNGILRIFYILFLAIVIVSLWNVFISHFDIK